MQDFISTQDWTREQLSQALEMANQLKKAPIQELFKGKSVALIFINPSLRTRSSFEIGVQQMGGIAFIVEPGRGAWPIEFETGVTMDAGPEEHISEVAKVLSRYADLIAIRIFPVTGDWAFERTDPYIRALKAQATVPVINMETILHPCQEMAHIMTLQERLGELAGRKYLLTWTNHPRALNTAVANSALLIATRFGMEVTLLCPGEDYILDPQFMDAGQENAAASGGSLAVSFDIEASYEGAEIVYAKSWGAPKYFGDPEAGLARRGDLSHFMVDEAKMALTKGALFSHCLPLRRNVKASDGVMDADYCVAIDEAENRLHVQKAIMAMLLGFGPGDLSK